MADGGITVHIWLGAEHMVTGYDHLLFLFGVILFLTGFLDVVRFITAFTLGQCITLLGATLADVTADAQLIGAVIALSVVYKGFENLGGFEIGTRAPNLLAMVFIFGLIHGFGLSTRLQDKHIERGKHAISSLFQPAKTLFARSKEKPAQASVGVTAISMVCKLNFTQTILKGMAQIKLWTPRHLETHPTDSSGAP
jgi:hypothetical protein